MAEATSPIDEPDPKRRKIRKGKSPDLTAVSWVLLSTTQSSDYPHEQARKVAGSANGVRSVASSLALPARTVDDVERHATARSIPKFLSLQRRQGSAESRNSFSTLSTVEAHHLVISRKAIYTPPHAQSRPVFPVAPLLQFGAKEPQANVRNYVRVSSTHGLPKPRSTSSAVCPWVSRPISMAVYARPTPGSTENHPQLDSCYSYPRLAPIRYSLPESFWCWVLSYRAYSLLRCKTCQTRVFHIALSCPVS